MSVLDGYVRQAAGYVSVDRRAIRWPCRVRRLVARLLPIAGGVGSVGATDGVHVMGDPLEFK